MKFIAIIFPDCYKKKTGSFFAANPDPLPNFHSLSNATVLPHSGDTIYVLRNNDIGDLIVVTPLFEALRKLHPKAKILVGIGDWNRAVLQGNPYIDETIATNAPWHNAKLAKASSNPFVKRLQRWIVTPFAALKYILFSPEVKWLAKQRPTIGIDVLGSRYGAWLFRRVAIRRRLGVRGYDGGDRWMQQTIDVDYECYVGKAALKFASLLGLNENDLPGVKPQLFLSAVEMEEAEAKWNTSHPKRKKRLVVGFGSGVPEKCWPTARFKVLFEMLEDAGGWSIILVGGPEERLAGEDLAGSFQSVTSLAGQVSLRESFALTGVSDAVVTNSSMLMHVAAAFEKPTAVVLGMPYESADGHAKLWSCNPRAVNLGREISKGRDEIASAQEVFDFLQNSIPSLEAR